MHCKWAGNGVNCKLQACHINKLLLMFLLCFASNLTGVLVAMHVVQVARLLAQDHPVQTLVNKAVVVFDNLPHQLGRRHAAD